MLSPEFTAFAAVFYVQKYSIRKNDFICRIIENIRSEMYHVTINMHIMTILKHEIYISLPLINIQSLTYLNYYKCPCTNLHLINNLPWLY
jgi:hypothetical protein